MQDNQIKRMTDYLFHCDFTEFSKELSETPVGEIDGDTAVLLAAILQEKDTGEGRAHWNVESDTPWSLYGASVVYNGPNSRNYPTKFKYDSVLVINFPSTEFIPNGRMYVQYNQNA